MLVSGVKDGLLRHPRSSLQIALVQAAHAVEPITYSARR
jgi:hypothetical protein